MACCLTATSHYLNPCGLLISEVQWYSHESNFTVSAQSSEFENCTSKMTAAYFRDQWVNSLGPSFTIWWHGSGSTLVQVMACCLTAPSHLSSLSPVIGQFHKIPNPWIDKISLKVDYLKFRSNLPGANELNWPIGRWFTTSLVDRWPDLY